MNSVYFQKDVANELLGPMAFVIPLGVVFSGFGAQLSSMFVSGRFLKYIFF